MIDSYVQGFFHSFDLEKWLLIDKGLTLSKAGNKLKWTGLGGKIKTPLIPTNREAQDGAEAIVETPHEAMEREFLEESGHKVSAKRWHCFHIKTYNNCKIYMFHCAASSDELQKAVYAKRGLPEGDVAIADYVAMLFKPEDYTFDLRYLLPMIILESQRGMIHQLDPEGVNSGFKKSL